MALGGVLRNWLVDNLQDQQVRCLGLLLAYSKHTRVPAARDDLLNFLQHCRGQALGVFGPPENRRLVLVRPSAPVLLHVCWVCCEEACQPAHHDTPWYVFCFPAQLLQQLMTQVGMTQQNRPTIWRSSFSRPAYDAKRIPRPVGGDWVVLRDVVHVEHPQYAHVIDNKLMDAVRVSTCCAVLCWAGLCWAVLCCAGLGWAGLGWAGVLCWAGLGCAVLCCAVLCCAVLCCAVLCCAVLCCAVLCCAVLCCAGLGWFV
jgi:hypothetical protein